MPFRFVLNILTNFRGGKKKKKKNYYTYLRLRTQHALTLIMYPPYRVRTHYSQGSSYGGAPLPRGGRRGGERVLLSMRRGASCTPNYWGTGCARSREIKFTKRRKDGIPFKFVHASQVDVARHLLATLLLVCHQKINLNMYHRSFCSRNIISPSPK